MGPYSIGVDLGGTNLRAAAVDEKGKVLKTWDGYPDETPEKFIADINRYLPNQ